MWFAGKSSNGLLESCVNENYCGFVFILGSLVIIWCALENLQ